jgi:hypothetical protein
VRDDGGQAIFFYSRHPITADIILSKLRASRGNLDGLRPEDLYPHDQDHYGGLDANDVLAAATGISEGVISHRRAPSSVKMRPYEVSGDGRSREAVSAHGGRIVGLAALRVPPLVLRKVGSVLSSAFSEPSAGDVSS